VLGGFFALLVEPAPPLRGQGVNPTPTPGCVLPKSIRIAVIGDYGVCTEDPVLCEAEAAVAHFVKAAGPDFVITVGDNVSKGSIDGDGDVKDPPDLMAQAGPLSAKLNQSAACWKLLYMHHPMFTRGERNHPTPDPLVREFATAVASGAPGKVDAMLSGHVHAFEYATVPGDNAWYFTNGKGGAGGHPLAAFPQPPAVRVWHKDHPLTFGFMIINVVSGGAGTQSTLSFEFHSVAKLADVQPTPTPGGPPTPIPTPATYWHQRWISWKNGPWTKSKDCSTPQLTCNAVGGPCVLPAFLVPVTGPCATATALPLATPTPGGPPTATPAPACGSDSIDVAVVAGFNCPDRDQLIGAIVDANICCDLPWCPDEDGTCGMKLEAYDCRGNKLGEWCMNYYPAPPRHELITGCVFDRWTLPCRWMIRRNGSAYKLLCYGSTVRYYCCVNPLATPCARAYDKQ
jgi:hypothetical protein